MELQTKSTWLLTCKEATYFSGLREEGLLPVWLRLRLSFHTFSCGPCKRFIHQMKQLAERLKSSEDRLSQSTDVHLSENEKSSLQDQIREAMKQ